MPFIAQQLSADGVAADGRVVLATAVLEAITNDHIATVAVNAGGSGYAVGDTFRLNAGTPVNINGDDFHATARVIAEAAGVATAIELISAGSYTVLPGTTAIATTTLTGAGSGITVDLTTTTALYTEDERTNFDNVDFQTDGDWLATSVKSANAPTIGMRSNISATNDAVQLMIASSYDSGLPWRDQPGNPPNSDFWLGVPNQDPFVYISTTERRVNILITDGTNKQYGQMGLFLPFTDVASNYPFPAIVAGQSTSIRAFTEALNASNSGLLHPINFSSPGCYQYRDNLSPSWFGITSDNNSGTQTTVPGIIWPNTGERGEFSFNRAPVPTNGVGGVDADDMTPGAGINGQTASTYPKIYGVFNEANWYASDADSSAPQGPAPLGIGSQLHFTTQAHIIAVEPNDPQMIGVIDGLEAVHLRGLFEFDEIENENGDRYLVFSDTNDTSLFRGVAMEII